MRQCQKASLLSGYKFISSKYHKKIMWDLAALLCQNECQQVNDWEYW